MDLQVLQSDVRTEPSFELIERKGRGHPDTLSDGLAEALSRAYANYTLREFGVILHHNFDKVGLLGGRSQVGFGNGQLTSPIRVLLNGRASSSCGDRDIPVIDLLSATARSYLGGELPLLDPNNDLCFMNNLSTAPSPGHVDTGEDKLGNRKNWFAPQHAADIREVHRTTSNDTSVGCAHWPLSRLEQCVLDLERWLTSTAFASAHRWLGSDIKVMAHRVGSAINVTMCVPQIANFTASLAEYKEHLRDIARTIKEFLGARLPGSRITLWLNTKDDYDLPELYLTAIGTSIESGDEGLVGRGNRPNGLIAMDRPYSMEGLAGKNPVYHVGKLYNLVAMKAAQSLYRKFDEPVEVWIVSQEGRQLDDPWQAVVKCQMELPELEVAETLALELNQISKLTDALLAGEILAY